MKKKKLERKPKRWEGILQSWLMTDKTKNEYTIGIIFDLFLPLARS